jgi:hypothetical protein
MGHKQDHKEDYEENNPKTTKVPMPYRAIPQKGGAIEPVQPTDGRQSFHNAPVYLVAQKLTRRSGPAVIGTDGLCPISPLSTVVF